MITILQNRMESSTCSNIGPYADLRGCELSNANLSNTNLFYADLYGANLSGANFSSAVVTNVNFGGAITTGITPPTLSGCLHNIVCN
ncbi:MAG: pentapeptide repeat-containing protein [Thaumarchaeota archaeon]|nr:pentapeptide repeat-containing protein [Nitrososphaerota archaeon]